MIGVKIVEEDKCFWWKMVVVGLVVIVVVYGIWWVWNLQFEFVIDILENDMFFMVFMKEE